MCLLHVGKAAVLCSAGRIMNRTKSATSRSTRLRVTMTTRPDMTTSKRLILRSRTLFFLAPRATNNLGNYLPLPPTPAPPPTLPHLTFSPHPTHHPSSHAHHHHHPPHPTSSPPHPRNPPHKPETDKNTSTPPSASTSPTPSTYYRAASTASTACAPSAYATYPSRG